MGLLVIPHTRAMDINAIITLVFVIVGAILSGIHVVISYECLMIERRREQQEVVGFLLFIYFFLCFYF